ncbi:hypothetical protein [Moorena sp. SIOASIH]|nr:hypothetical protein [Moorena sp. SIOASIH]
MYLIFVKKMGSVGPDSRFPTTDDRRPTTANIKFCKKNLPRI